MNPKQRQSAQWQALPGCGHAERALQASWWQEHGAAHDGGPRAQQASKIGAPPVTIRPLFAARANSVTARSISPASCALAAVNSTPRDGATELNRRKLGNPGG